MDKETKSLEFIKSQIESFEYSFVDREYAELIEVIFPDFIKLFTAFSKDWKEDNTMQLILRNEDVVGHPKELNVTVNYEPDADFDYFIEREIICDGNRGTQTDLAYEVLDDVLSCDTFLQATAPLDVGNFWKYDRIYTVGNFIYGTERSVKFAVENPGCMTRFSVFIPLKCELVEHKNEETKDN